MLPFAETCFPLLIARFLASFRPPAFWFAFVLQLEFNASANIYRRKQAVSPSSRFLHSIMTKLFSSLRVIAMNAPRASRTLKLSTLCGAALMRCTTQGARISHEMFNGNRELRMKLTRFQVNISIKEIAF